MNKNYNFERKKLQLPEYGRHIHEMVDYLGSIDDRTERNRQAQAVIGVMGNLFPLLRDTADYTHKLWDHLFIMADFNLDVDSPYPIPSAEELAPRPEKMGYPTRRIAIKHYGKNVENILRSLRGVRNEAAADEVVGNVARYMRTKSYEYNQEHPNNEVIIRDIRRMAGGDIPVDEAAIGNLRSEYKQPSHYTPHGKKDAAGGRKQYGAQQHRGAQHNGQSHGKERYQPDAERKQSFRRQK